MRVLLIATVTEDWIKYTPLNLLYLAGSRYKDDDVTIVDENIVGRLAVYDEIRREYDEVGLSVLSTTRWDSFEMGGAVRRLSPKTKVVMGGVHASLVPDQCRVYANEVVKDDGIDEDVLDVEPRWDLIDLSKYPGKGITKYDFRKFNGIDLRNEPRVSVMGSRSCDLKCDFCSSWWLQGKYRMRDPVKMVDELEMLNNKYGIKSFYFIDDSFYLDKARCLEFCEEVVKRGLPIAFLAQTKAEVIDKEYAEALREAGCYRMLVGVEGSSHPKSRGATQAIRNLKKAGICAEALFIVGNVGETDATIEETRRWIKKAKPSLIYCSNGLLIYPGTKVYRDCLKSGEIDEKFWYTSVPVKTYRFSQSQIKKWRKRLLTHNTMGKLRYLLD